jgi:predicted Zn-dependent peptidase
VPAERLQLALDVLGDIVSDSQLAPEDVDKERMVILEELKMYQDQPQDYVHSLFEQIMWPDHPLGRDIVGTTTSLTKMTREDLAAYISQHYRLNRLVVGIAGGIDPEEALDITRDRLSLSGEPVEPEDRPPGRLSSAQALVFGKQTEQAHICLGARALSYVDPDRHTLDLINTILGEGMSSRLFLEIRERRGLAYDVHSYTSKHSDGGYFAIYMGVDPKQAESAIEAVIGELRRMVDDQVPDDELTKAKEFTKGRLRLGLESTNAMASWLGHQQLLMGRIRTVDEVVASVDAVTAADIARVSTALLEGPLQLAVIGPFEREQPFRQLIGA